jgi:hypothetical protein
MAVIGILVTGFLIVEIIMSGTSEAIRTLGVGALGDAATVGSTSATPTHVSPVTPTLDRLVAEHNKKEAAKKHTSPASKP